MATLPQTDPLAAEPKLTLEEAAEQLYRLVEEHYDERGLSQEERDERYAAAREFLDSKHASNARV